MIESYEKIQYHQRKSARGGAMLGKSRFYSEFSARGSKLDKVSDSFT